MRGKVKWFNEDKGYGFIAGENGKDAFVHINTVPDGGDMTEGREVEYETEVGPKGLRATAVRLLTILLIVGMAMIADCGLRTLLCEAATQGEAGVADCQAAETVEAAATAPAAPAVQVPPAEMIDFTAMLGSPLMIVIVTGALVQVVKKKAAEIDLLAKVPIWCYAVAIAGGLTCLATYGLGTLQGAFWPLIVNIIANVLWTLGGYGLLMGLTKTPATAAAGDVTRQKSGGGWAGMFLPGALAVLVATSGGCNGMSNGQKYIIASQSYTSTANVLAVLVRAGEFTTADKRQIKALSDEADKLLDEMRADLLADPPAAMNFTYLVTKINALLDELLRMQLAAEAAKANAKAVSYGTGGNPAGDQNGNRDARAAVDGGGRDPTDRASTDAGGDRRGHAAPQNGQAEPRRGPCRDAGGQPTDLMALIEVEWD